MKKIFYLTILLCILIINSYTQEENSGNAEFTIEISNVVPNGGKVHLRIFLNVNELNREQPSITYILDDINTVISHKISLQYGEYVFGAFQDTNGNGVMDYGALGIPKELVGVSNYFGRGLPTKIFNRQKVIINNSTEIIRFGLHKF